PSDPSRSTTTGPERSGYTPATARLEAVTTATLKAPSSFTTPPVPLLATGLLLHPYPGDLGLGVERLDHVDQAQGPRHHTGERLPLDARAISSTHRGPDVDTFVHDREFDVRTVHRDGVTQRHQIRGAFGALDTRDPGDRQRVPLRHLAGTKCRDGLRREQYPSRGRGRPRADALPGNIDHARRPGRVEVGERGRVAGVPRLRGVGHHGPVLCSYRTARNDFPNRILHDRTVRPKTFRAATESPRSSRPAVRRLSRARPPASRRRPVRRAGENLAVSPGARCVPPHDRVRTLPAHRAGRSDAPEVR